LALWLFPHGLKRGLLETREPLARLSRAPCRLICFPNTRSPTLPTDRPRAQASHHRPRLTLAPSTHPALAATLSLPAAARLQPPRNCHCQRLILDHITSASTSDGRPSLLPSHHSIHYPLLPSAVPPYLTRPLPPVHHSFHFLLLPLPDTRLRLSLCPRVRPGCRTPCNISPSLLIKHRESETRAPRPSPISNPPPPPRHITAAR
jgi:hypothetical protein